MNSKDAHFPANWARATDNLTDTWFSCDSPVPPLATFVGQGFKTVASLLIRRCELKVVFNIHLNL